jgi:hypothetical protein
MTKIAGALNMLPTTILNKSITNDSTQEAIKIYFSAGIKGIFGFKYKRTSRPVFSNFIEVVDAAAKHLLLFLLHYTCWKC